MPTYDFFAPFCRVALTRPDGARLPLWFGQDTLKDADKFKYDDAPQVGGLGTNLAIVNNVEIEQALGNFFIVTVSCSPTFEDAMALFESTAIVTGETLLEVQYGYTSVGGELATRKFVGMLTDPDFSIGQEITITLKAQCTCAASMYGSSTVDGDKAQQKLTRREWIKLVAKGAGAPEREVEVDFDSITGTRELALLDEVISFSMAGKNDNIVLRDLVEQCLCEVYYTPSKKDFKVPVLKVLDRQTRFGGKGNKIFQLYGFGQRDTRSLGGDANAGGLYPILGVTTQSKQVFIRGVVNGTTRVKVDETKKNKPKTETTQAEDNGTPAVGSTNTKKEVAKRPEKGKNSPREKVEGGVTTGGTLTQMSAEEFATQKAADEAQELAQFIQSGIQLSVESIGVPDLEPGAIVEVQGLGSRFSGFYSILKVIHSIGDNGYTTRWDGINNAGYLTGLEDALKAKVKAIVDARELEGSITIEPQKQ